MDYLFFTLLGVVLLFWVGVALVRAGLVGTGLLVLLAGSCFGYDFYHVSAGVPITVDRLLFLVMIAQYVLYRRWGWADPKPLAKPDYVLFAFLGVLALSTLTHNFMAERASPLAHLVLFYGMPAVVYWIARQAAWSERTAWSLFGALALFGVYLAITAIAETREMWSLVFPKYIVSPDFPDYYGRGRGPFLSPMANGFVMSVSACAALLWWPRLNRWGQLLLLAAMPLYLFGIYSTLTRSVWMGAGLGLFVIVALSVPGRWRYGVVVSAVLAGILVPVVGWDNLMVFKREKGVEAEVSADSAKLRPILAAVAWKMFQDRPLLGCGYGQYSKEMTAYLSDRSLDLPLETARPYVQHNVFLGLLTETGLIGMTLFAALLAYWAWAAWLLWSHPHASGWMRLVGLLFLAALGAYLPNAMFHDMSLIPMVNMSLFFLAGASTGLSVRAGRAPSYRIVTPPERTLGEPQLVG